MLALTKWLFYLRIYNEYSLIVTLIWKIIVNIKAFMSIFVTFIALFALCYHVLGVEFKPIDENYFYFFAAIYNSYEMSTTDGHNGSFFDQQDIEHGAFSKTILFTLRIF